MTRILTTAALLAATTGAFAMGHGAWDMDGSGALSPEEFNAGFGAMGTHGGFDTDGDALLDEAEWTAGPAEVGEWVNMDLNGDGGVDSTEYNALLFNRYDTDGSGAIEASEMAMIDADLATGGMLSQ
ncbi:EF-hand domain-containing protein [Jannaschia ovalis]|uniref:EF-hand domain-containing protein n=1 Tax=Jannaschia ovalis TaxID=3038773 RepID=A0ABY8LA98_9RHOB|nr:hypothetical protein [Jannaschia sp. GRR-S6-38]WGH78265.1 hypothetical protein P8627_14725 [Jannaschia sp. GRR-S6-38]